MGMGFLDSIKAMFSEGTKSLDEDLSRREAELSATPEERMEMLQDEIEDNDSAFEDLQSKIDRKGAVALAETELDEQEHQVHLDRTEHKEPSDEDPTVGTHNTAETNDDNGIVDAVLAETDEITDSDQ